MAPLERRSHYNVSRRRHHSRGDEKKCGYNEPRSQPERCSSSAYFSGRAVASGGVPNPTAPNTPLGSSVVDIGVLVFREGLECILVLAAITASMVGASKSYRRPIAVGVVTAFIATLLTWRIAIAIVVTASQTTCPLFICRRSLGCWQSSSCLSS